MKIIDATSWEKRNFERDAFEVVLDRSDLGDVQGLMDALNDKRFDGAYVCIKLPVGNIEVLHALEDVGFRFLESQFELVDHFNVDDLVDQLHRLKLDLESEVIPKDHDQWQRVLSKVTPGMFVTDRVALDPCFGPDIACKRYLNWCWDLYENPDSQMTVYKCQGREVAFNLLVYDSKKGKNDGVLGGVFEEFKDAGLGVAVVLDEIGRRKFGKRKTHVSSNNLPVLRLHQRCGRIITNEVYVLRKVYD